MSDDLTEQLPSDDARDTTPMLRQLLAEVREFRAETGERLARVETTLEQLEREIGAFKSETHQALRDMNRAFAQFQRDSLGRYLDVEGRVEKLEGEAPSR